MPTLRRAHACAHRAVGRREHVSVAAAPMTERARLRIGTGESRCAPRACRRCSCRIASQHLVEAHLPDDLRDRVVVARLVEQPLVRQPRAQLGIAVQDAPPRASAAELRPLLGQLELHGVRERDDAPRDSASSARRLAARRPTPRR